MTNQPEISGLQQHVGYWLRFVSNHVSHSFSQKVEARGVTVAEWAVMREMLDLGPTNPSLLAEKMGLTRGAISKLLERLCAKQLAERTSSDHDRRYQSVCLTPKGRRLVPTLSRLADENDAEFFGHLTTKQRSRLSETLMEIVQRQGWKDIPVS